MVTVSSRWPRWSRLRGPMITTQSRRGHSSVTSRSQLNHGICSMITAQSRLGHSSITAESRLAVTILVTVSTLWSHHELTVSSHGGQFFLMGCGPTELGAYRYGLLYPFIHPSVCWHNRLSICSVIESSFTLLWFTCISGQTPMGIHPSTKSLPDDASSLLLLWVDKHSVQHGRTGWSSLLIVLI